jgi:hypothetical protein
MGEGVVGSRQVVVLEGEECTLTLWDGGVLGCVASKSRYRG